MLNIAQLTTLSTVTATFIFGLLFLLFSIKSKTKYLVFWGFCWISCSALFLLDFLYLGGEAKQTFYTSLRLLFSLAGSILFLFGTRLFFQTKNFKPLIAAAPVFFISLMWAIVSSDAYYFISIPNAMYSTLLLIIAGNIFISYYWQDRVPEKTFAGFLIILWAATFNHLGFTSSHLALSTFNYILGMLTIDLLIVFLMVLHFKKERFFIDKRQSHFRLLVENSSDAMFLYDYKKKRFEYITPSAEKMICVPIAFLLKHPGAFFNHAEVYGNDQKIDEMFYRPISSSGMTQLRITEPDTGNVQWSEMHYIPIYDDLGKIVAIEGILRDNSTRKKMEQNIEEFEDARRQLIENISHELRTPITLIQGYLESILNGVLPQEVSRSYIKMAHSKTIVLNMLLDDLIQVPQLTSQDLNYKFYEWEARTYFSNLVDGYNRQAADCSLDYSTEINIPSEGVVIIDPVRIEQVLSNLINNSCQHTEAGGSIHISCYLESSSEPIVESQEEIMQGEIVCSVRDTGKGFEQDHIEHVFERNFRGENSLNWMPKDKGSGLGLFISMQIIKQHSGRIWADNHPGGGAIVSFTLPYYTNNTEE